MQQQQQKNEMKVKIFFFIIDRVKQLLAAFQQADRKPK